MRAANRAGVLRQTTIASVIGLCVGAGLAGCGSSPGKTASGTGGNGPTTGTAGGTSGTSGAAGSPGSPGVAGSGSGGAGTVGAAGSAGAVGSAGGAGAPGAAGGAGTPDAGPVTDAGAGDFPKAACAPGAIFCDDFESYPVQPAFDPMGNLRDFIQAGDTAPTWLGYHFHGPPYVVNLSVFGGKKVYQLDTEGGHIVGADIIKESPDGVDLWPAAHYGRFMANFKAIPPHSAFGILSESGLLPGSPNEAQFTVGGVNGKLSFTYSTRKRPFKNDVSTPKMRLGGDAENASQAWTTQCTKAATTQALPAAKWVCVEWMIDRTKPEFHLWLDGVEQTEISVTGNTSTSAATCSVGTAPTWAGPEHFTELDLGWEVYGTDGPGWGAQYDMFAVGTQKIGCPTP